MLFHRCLWVSLGAALLSFAVPARAATPETLRHWPTGADPKEIGRRVAQNFIARPYKLLGEDKIIHYAETCTWTAALTFADITGDTALNDQLVERFQPLFGVNAHLVPKPRNVDYTVFGAVPLQLYVKTKDARYLTMGKFLADQQWTTPPDAASLSPEAREGIAAGLSWHTRFWIDDMYMITKLQTAAFRATGDKKYLDRAAAEAVAYLEKLQQPNGLFFHAPDVHYFWGRGNGWFAAGMPELLRELPINHPHRARLLRGYQEMMATLLRHQDANGMWHQLIDDPASWPETSCTGMFTYGFIVGVQNGWLDAATYAPAARKAWLALIPYVDANANIREVCEGTNKLDSRQYYLDRGRIVGDLHGQAPLLWCSNALLSDGAK